MAWHSCLAHSGVHTFGRSDGLFAARKEDFVLSRTSGTWTLPLSKSGQRAGAQESILLTDPFVVTALHKYFQSFAVGDLLSQVTPGTVGAVEGPHMRSVRLTIWQMRF